MHQREKLGQYANDSDTFLVSKTIYDRLLFLEERLHQDRNYYENLYQQLNQITDQKIKSQELHKISGWQEYFEIMPELIKNIKFFCINLGEVLNGNPPLDKKHPHYYNLLCALLYFERLTLNLNTVIKSPKFAVPLHQNIPNAKQSQQPNDTLKIYRSSSSILDKVKGIHQFDHRNYIRPSDTLVSEARIKFEVSDDYRSVFGYRNVLNIRLDLERKFDELQLDISFPGSEDFFKEEQYEDLVKKLIRGTDNVERHHFFIKKSSQDEFERLSLFILKKLDGVIL